MGTASAACESTFDWYMRDLYAKHGLSTYVSLVIGAVHGDDVHIKADGLVDMNADTRATSSTRYQIASLTKTFTAMQAAIADEQQLFGPDGVRTTLQEIFDRTYPEHRLAFRRRDIRILELLQHYSGLPKDPPRVRDSHGDLVPPTEHKQLYEDACTMTPIFTPNQFYYSNMGYDVLGHLVAKLYSIENGDDPIVQWHARMAEELTLLGMNDTGTDADLPAHFHETAARGHSNRNADDGDPPMPAADYDPRTWPDGKYKRWDKMPLDDPAGGLWSTGDDLVKWVRLHLQLESSRGYDRHVERVLRQDRVTQADDGTANGLIGYAWQSEMLDDEHRVVWKGGDGQGYHAYIGLLPRRRMGSFVLANYDIGGTTKHDVGKRVLRELLGD